MGWRPYRKQFCMCMWCMFIWCMFIYILPVLDIYVQVWIHMCAYACRGPKLTPHVSIILHFIYWAKIPCRTPILQPVATCFAVCQGIPWPWLLGSEIQAPATTAQLFMWILQIPTWSSKHLIYWAITQAQTVFFLSLKFSVKPKIALEKYSLVSRLSGEKISWFSEVWDCLLKMSSVSHRPLHTCPLLGLINCAEWGDQGHLCLSERDFLEIYKSSLSTCSCDTR